MELVFVRTKSCKFSDGAEPFVNEFAKANNLTLTKYSSEENNIPKIFDKKEYPILYFVEDNKILGLIKGFSDAEKQITMYEAELKFIRKIEPRPIPPVEENNKIGE